jgi:hypothetical protein
MTKSRRDRRTRERTHRELVRDLDRLARLAPGGSPERPIDVRSPAMIEPLVARTACPLCDGSLRPGDHRVHVHAGESLRETRARCSRCAIERSLFFRIVPRRPH